jgi:hypothetical protein
MSSPGASVHRDAPPGIPAACRNCGAALSGRFCANCGQAADIHVPSTSELIHEALEGITHSDSRLWRTLWLLWFKPGKLTQEFVAGRRAAYLPPFRLYLVLSVIFFLVASFSHAPPAKVATMRGGKIQVVTSQSGCSDIQFELFRSPVWQQRLRHGCEVAVRDGGASLLHVAVGAMPKAMFIFLPLIAFLHMLLYWRPRHRYAEHLLFFVHVHAFFFSAMTLVVLLGSAAEAWPGVARATGILGPILLWSLPLYTVVAMKRVFGRGWGRTLLKAFALFAVYMVVLAITVAGVFLYAVLQL